MASVSQVSSISPDGTISPNRRPDKRRRTSQRSRRPSNNMLISPSPEAFESVEASSWAKVDKGHAHRTDDDEHSSIPIASSSRAAGKLVTPYLTKYVPQTYNPFGGEQSNSRAMETGQDSNTKYCNRHRPDVKCRRQADEESMDQLQNELATLADDDQQGIAHVWSLFSAAPAKQRNLMLRGILSVCCFPQLSFISTTIRDLIKIDFISLLPPEIAFNILCFLDTTSLCQASQVCRKWRQLADDDVVWHRMCEQHIDRKCTKCGVGLPLLERKRLRTEKRQIQLRASGRGLNEWSPNITPLPESPPLSGRKRLLESDSDYFNQPGSKRLCTQPRNGSNLEVRRPWKDVYKARFKVGTNWKYGRCSIKVLKGHTNGVMCLQFRGSILATGSYDTTVKIWCLDTMQEIRTLRGHTRGIRCLQFDDVRLMSGSIDGTIRVWDWRTGQCQRVLDPQIGGILSLHFTPGYLCAGTNGNFIQVWSICDRATFTLKGHGDFVNAVRIDIPSRTVFSASDDCTVKLWDLDTRRCIQTIRGHVGQVQQVLPLPPDFDLDVESYLDDQDQDTETENEHEQEQWQEQDEGGTSSAAPEENCDPEEHHTASKPPRKASPPPLVNHPFFPNQPDRPNPPQYMLTGSLDNTLRLWHVPTGRCLRKFFGHVEGVWALAADTLRIVSGAEDRTIKVWDWNGKCQSTYTGHTGPVTCIGLSGERLISGGEDCEIRVLEFGTDRHDSMNDANA